MAACSRDLARLTSLSALPPANDAVEYLLHAVDLALVDIAAGRSNRRTRQTWAPDA
jgi:hypothetical protein